MCFLDEFKAQSQKLVFTNSIYRRRHGNKYAPSDQINGLELIPMLSFCLVFKMSIMKLFGVARIIFGPIFPNIGDI